MKSYGAIVREIKNIEGVMAIRRHTAKPYMELLAARQALKWALGSFPERPSWLKSDAGEFALMKELRK